MEQNIPNTKRKDKRNLFVFHSIFLLMKTNVLYSYLNLKHQLKHFFIEILKNIKKINSLTISKTPTCKYYISINVEEEIIHRQPITKVDKKTKTVGIDLGLTHFLITSKGRKIKSPKYLRKSEGKLKKAQKRLSKKKKGSKNRDKQRKIVAKLHEIISNQRKDFIHKTSQKIVNENQVIYIETLKVNNMLKNRRLSKSIADAGWGEFIRQLKYKAHWQGSIVVQIGQFEPTSKLCSTLRCEYKNQTLCLSDRFWECPICKTIHDRDINAAINIEKIGREASELKPVEKVANVFSIKKIQANSKKQESLAS